MIIWVTATGPKRESSACFKTSKKPTEMSKQRPKAVPTWFQLEFQLTDQSTLKPDACFFRNVPNHRESGLNGLVMPSFISD